MELQEHCAGYQRPQVSSGSCTLGRWEQDVIVSRGQGQVMSQEFQDRLEKLTGDLIAQESMTSP